MNLNLNLNLPPQQVILYGIAIAAALIYLPYFAVAYARFKIGIDFNAPRAMFDKLPDYAKRATWAHQNSFEVFSLFVAAALMVYAAGKGSEYTTLLVLAFVGSRLLYSIFYIANLPPLRSLMWAISMFCIANLMSASFSAIAVQ
jgi:uncharacterized MAPEG superfamily protein